MCMNRSQLNNRCRMSVPWVCPPLCPAICQSAKRDKWVTDGRWSFSPHTVLFDQKAAGLMPIVSSSHSSPLISARCQTCALLARTAVLFSRTAFQRTFFISRSCPSMAVYFHSHTRSTIWYLMKKRISMRLCNANTLHTHTGDSARQQIFSKPTPTPWWYFSSFYWHCYVWLELWVFTA